MAPLQKAILVAPASQVVRRREALLDQFHPVVVACRNGMAGTREPLSENQLVVSLAGVESWPGDEPTSPMNELAPRRVGVPNRTHLRGIEMEALPELRLQCATDFSESPVYVVGFVGYVFTK